MSNLDECVINVINEYRNRFNKDVVNLAVMVSGGIDSMVLLDVLSKLRKEINVKLTVIHIKFNDFNSHKEATNLVKGYSFIFNVDYVEYESNILTAINVKKQAREEMKEVAFLNDYDLILTGHHKDDQIETILFRLLRGTGPEGLVGMKALTEYIKDNKKRIFGKPFLNVSKNELTEYSRKYNISYVEDETNKDINNDRNYIRNVILPLLSFKFETNNILTTSMLIKDSLIKEEFINVDIYKGEWDTNEFLKLSIGNRVFVIKEYLSKVLGYNINKQIYKALDKVLSEDISNLKLSINKVFELRREKNKIVIKQTQSLQ